MRRGVIQTVNEIELWAVFGSRRDYLDAPPETVLRVTLALQARGEAAAEQQREMDEEARRGGGSGGGGSSSSGGRTTMSRYEP